MSRQIEKLIRALEDWNYLDRSWAAWALVKIGPPAVEPLCRALKDRDNGVRSWAASALGRIGDNKTLPRVVLTDTRLSVEKRLNALHALHAAGRTPPVRALLQQLTADDDESVRSAAARVREAWTLLRPGTRCAELLRPVAGSKNSPAPQQLLRPTAAPHDPPQRKGLRWPWRREG